MEFLCGHLSFRFLPESTHRGWHVPYCFFSTIIHLPLTSIAVVLDLLGAGHLSLYVWLEHSSLTEGKPTISPPQMLGFAILFILLCFHFLVIVLFIFLLQTCSCVYHVEPTLFLAALELDGLAFSIPQHRLPGAV